ncbi:hypothetical protein BCR32DRAFT_269647 [Anaeromyces robustus]|uniref:Transglutaminase-like domain-containing protein n=1 Tax=Anaeromyces robustus TaxID=1754192 RepID=A0A1Y1X124_9FUNG|nr:hypothetical protein BCR32DRAFT_269647 [Anaeromyces robustus]|eukprot:ORX79126.1 hypothetical protein BCR32DRAFT_269647 [Anaeromyces robustus]
MKFINLAIIALSSASLVLSKPVTDKNQCKDKLCYLVSGSTGGTAYVKGFNTGYTNSKTLSIPSSVNIDGNVFTINGIDYMAFNGLKTLEEISIASGINKLTLTYGAFSELPNLKKVTLSNKSFDARDLSSFSSPNKEVMFIGNGVKDYTNNQVKYLFKNVFGLKAKTYQDEYDYQRKTDLFELAKTVSSYARLSDNRDGDNAITVLKTKFGTSLGRARLFRLLAIELGIKASDIKVAYDGNKKYWNYIRVNGSWYNCDVNYPYRTYSQYYEAEWKYPFFVGASEFKKRESITANPKQWRVMLTNYGYRDESRGQPTNEIFTGKLMD